MAWVATAITVGTTAYGAVSSANAAADSAGMTQESLNRQAKIDEAQSIATSNAMIAKVNSQNKKLEDIDRSIDIMKTQGKADSMMRLEGFNEIAAMQLVMGAASGRVSGVGSIGAIMNKSREDFMWDQMWNSNTIKINENIMEQDKSNILESGYNSLWGAQEAAGINVQAQQQQYQNTADSVQLRYDQTVTNGLMAMGGAIAPNANQIASGLSGNNLFRLSDGLKPGAWAGYGYKG